MARYIGSAQMREVLRKALKNSPTRSAWALTHGVDQETISRVLAGKRDMPESIAKVLGYTKVTLFTKRSKEHP